MEYTPRKLLTLDLGNNYDIFHRILCVFLSVLVVVPCEMPALTSEKLEKILDEKLRPISDLSEQLEQALGSISSLNTTYDNILVTLSQLKKDKTALVEENASLRTQVLSIINDLKQVKSLLMTYNSIPEETAQTFVASLFLRNPRRKTLMTL